MFAPRLLSEICDRLFQFAGRGDRRKPPWVHGPILETGGTRPWPIIDTRPGGFPPAHRMSLCIGNGEQFAVHRRLLLNEVFRIRLLFADLAAWRFQKGTIHDVFGRFFGNRYATNLPSILWLSPWYMWGTNRGNTASRDEHQGRRVYGEPRKPPKLLTFGFPSKVPDLNVTLDLRRLIVEYPDERGVRPEYVWMRRRRSGSTTSGHQFVVSEENLGLASPDDRAELDTGYYPASRKYRVEVPGAMLYWFRLLMLARLHPNGSGRAVVDHLILTFNPESACIIDIGTYVRSFSVFLQHYPIQDLILHALSQRSNHVQEP